MKGSSLTWRQKLMKWIKQMKKRNTTHVMLITAIIIGVMSFLQIYSLKADYQVTTENDAEFTATFVGDMMFGRYVEKTANMNGYDHLFRYVKPYFEQSDYVSGNLESPIVKGQYEKAEKSIHFRASEEVGQLLKENHFDTINLANNHMMDYGENSLRETVKTLEQYEVKSVGAGENLDKASAILYQKIKGRTIATIGASEVLPKNFAADQNTLGILPAAKSILVPIIQEASQHADMVVVHVHWGDEYVFEPQENQQNLAKAIVDAGADVIIGHHPHVLSSFEVYKGSVIFYSLGNFVFDQGWSMTKETAIAQYHIDEKQNHYIEITPAFIKNASPIPLVEENVKKNPLLQLRREMIFSRLTKGVNADQFEIKNGRIFVPVGKGA